MSTTRAYRERQRAALQRARYAPRWCEWCGKGCTCNSCTAGRFEWDHIDKASKTREIGRMFGSASDAAIERELKKCRPLCADHNKLGGRNGAEVLNAELVRDIRARARTGRSGAAIARELGLAARTVTAVVSGELWPERALHDHERSPVDDRVF